jgi:hypothetical protein
MTGRGVPQPSVGSSEASLLGLSPTSLDHARAFASGIGSTVRKHLTQPLPGGRSMRRNAATVGLLPT